MNDQVFDIFTKFLYEAKFIKFQDLLRLQATTIMRGCVDVIPPPKSTKLYVNGGVSEPIVMMVQHNFRSYGDILLSCQVVEQLNVYQLNG